MVGRLSHLSRKVSSQRADELLEDFGLSDAGDRVLKTYSGGMRRRLDLAAALVANPPVLFLDEPTTGLDPQSRQSLWAAIEDLVREGTTVLLTTQYLEEADRLARDIVVIDHGRVIAEGTPAQLKADLGTSVVSVTLGDRDAVAQAVALLAPFSEKAPVIEDVVVELTVTDGPKAGADVLRALDAAQIPIAGLALREPSLDDVFLNLTGHKTTIDDEVDRDREAEAGPGPGPQERRSRREGCRMTTTAITAPVRAQPAEPGQPPVVGRVRHHDDHVAQPAGAHPDARGALLHHVAADHVRAALHLRLRRRHPRPGRPLHPVPDAGHLRADGHLRRHEHGGRALRGPPQGLDRALPRPADEPLRRAGRAHDRGPGPQRLRGRAHHGRRLRRGLPHRDQRRVRSPAACC